MIKYHEIVDISQKCDILIDVKENKKIECSSQPEQLSYTPHENHSKNDFLSIIYYISFLFK